jgi:hypothetical protein
MNASMCVKPEPSAGDGASTTGDSATERHARVIDWQSMTLPGKRAKNFGRRYDLLLSRFSNGTLLLEIQYSGDGTYREDTHECETLCDAAEALRAYDPCQYLYRPDIPQLQGKFDKIEEHVERKFNRLVRDFLKECRQTLRVLYPD